MADATLLTTRQVATLLGCSRQHVVDLCASGKLPYVRIGTHRRIRRADVEAATTTRTLRREELRSLWLHQAVAGKFVADPDRAIATARRNLARMREAQPAASAWLDAWEHVLASGPEAILGTLTSTSRRAVDLRQNTPFAGILKEEERLAILSSFGTTYSDHSRR